MRIGIFGGTFNPIHIGHLRLAHIAYQTLQLDKIFFVPAFLSPHKSKQMIDSKHRLAMLNLALANENWAEISDCELIRKGKSYTIETLQHFQSIMPDVQINLLLGEDSFADFEQWHEYKSIMKSVNIIVMPRNIPSLSSKDSFADFIRTRVTEDLSKIKKAKNNKIFFLNSPVLNISSSQIRKTINQGYTAKYLVPDAVLTYIKSMELYV